MDFIRFYNNHTLLFLLVINGMLLCLYVNIILVLYLKAKDRSIGEKSCARKNK